MWKFLGYTFLISNLAFAVGNVLNNSYHLLPLNFLGAVCGAMIIKGEMKRRRLNK